MRYRHGTSAGHGWFPLTGRWRHLFVRGTAVFVLLLLLTACPGSRTGILIEKGQAATAQTQFANFASALWRYYADSGQVPTTQQGLRALLVVPSKAPFPRRWQGPYLNDLTTVPLDAWSHPFRYQSPGPNGERYRIVSYGADGRPGGTGGNADLIESIRSP